MANQLHHLFCTFEQDVRPVDVVLRKLERVSEGVVDVCLCREVQDGVDLFLPEEVQHQVR